VIFVECSCWVLFVGWLVLRVLCMCGDLMFVDVDVDVESYVAFVVVVVV